MPARQCFIGDPAQVAQANLLLAEYARRIRTPVCGGTPLVDLSSDAKQIDQALQSIRRGTFDPPVFQLDVVMGGC